MTYPTKYRLTQMLLAVSVFISAHASNPQTSNPETLSEPATIAPSWPQISAVNHVRFIDSKFDAKSFVGNGFLLNYRDRTYAVTAKHVLLVAKTDEMKTVDLTGQLKSWRMQVNGDPSKYVELGRLVNADSNEAIDENVLETDWLVFEVRENRSGLVPLKLSDNARASPGAVLYAVGCSYARKAKCRQDSFSGRLLGYAEHNLLVQLDDSKSALGGLSGGPVVDAQQRLVGIVSNYMPNPNGKGDVFAPASLDYLRAVLKANVGSTKASTSATTQ